MSEYQTRSVSGDADGSSQADQRDSNGKGHTLARLAGGFRLTGLLYLLAIAVAETITVFVNPAWGVVSHVAVLAALIVHSSVAWNRFKQAMLLTLALAPLVRIVSLSMPLAGIPRESWYPIIYAPLLGSGLVIMRIVGYTRQQVGLVLRRAPLIQAGVILAGFGLGLGEYLILRPEPLINELNWQTFLLPALAFVLAVGFVEEFIFRGLMQRSAFHAFGWWGIVYVSAVFAVLHMGFYSWLDVAFVFGIALFFGWAVKEQGHSWE